MKRFFRHFRFSMFGVAILCAALGLAVLMWPDRSMSVACWCFGGVLVLSGLLQIISYLTGEKLAFTRKLLMVSGIISVVLGVWIFFDHKRVMQLTIIVMGILLLYHGVMDVKYGFDIRSCEARGALPAMLFGLITCGIGVLVLVNPFENPAVLLWVIGLGFLFDGLTDLFTVVAVAGAKRKQELLSAQAPVIELDPAEAAVQVESAPEAGALPAEAAAESEPAPVAAENESDAAAAPEDAK